MEINDNIQTLKKSRWWDKGDVGRIVHKTYDSYDRVVYLGNQKSTYQLFI